MHQYGDWYAQSLLAVLNITSHSSTSSVPTCGAIIASALTVIGVTSYGALGHVPPPPELVQFGNFCLYI